jgi:hypothetical protein
MYNWCHGPSCHTKKHIDRIRGSKGNKVLRTRKINRESSGIKIMSGQYFCSQGCCTDLLINIGTSHCIAPRREALETPINDPKKETDNQLLYQWTIEKKAVDNA